VNSLCVSSTQYIYIQSILWLAQVREIVCECVCVYVCVCVHVCMCACVHVCFCLYTSSQTSSKLERVKTREQDQTGSGRNRLNYWSLKCWRCDYLCVCGHVCVGAQTGMFGQTGTLLANASIVVMSIVDNRWQHCTSDTFICTVYKRWCWIYIPKSAFRMSWHAEIKWSVW
jgi:hypothetical protein